MRVALKHLNHMLHSDLSTSRLEATFKVLKVNAARN